MKAKISTILNTNETTMWEKLQDVSSLIYVASPLIKFRAKKGHSLPEKWSLRNKVELELSLFGIMPLGDQIIDLVYTNQAERTIVSNEFGKLIKVWNHTIKFNAVNDQAIAYSDEIEIEAGVLTIPIWLFAHLFYRHRQRKWKDLIAADNQSNNLS
jgi:hypothetical protein